ncbi:uncharacterized protein LOC107630132 isoform X4 [Arachis ipaensis]|uniref:uncharacterized protein LOC107630132 isoform X4 n=1 Tax=Arachis ipaensis TaxID=130454 RepID=UPI000A2B72A8|nr:uncharacterized protein LOC107630132 isoform X4 [Arachis ipaensis]
MFAIPQITIKRTVSNSPLGLEFQLDITEVLCPALSEPGLCALLRFMTGLSVCLNRGDVNLKAQASLSEGENDSSLTRITIADLCLSDKFSHLPCTLVQPSMHSVKRESFHVPEFVGSLSKGKETSFPKLKKPDNVDITIELKGHKRWLKGGGYLAQKM